MGDPILKVRSVTCNLSWRLDVEGKHGGALQRGAPGGNCVVPTSPRRIGKQYACSGAGSGQLRDLPSPGISQVVPSIGPLFYFAFCSVGLCEPTVAGQWGISPCSIVDIGCVTRDCKRRFLLTTCTPYHVMSRRLRGNDASLALPRTGPIYILGPSSRSRVHTPCGPALLQ